MLPARSSVVPGRCGEVVALRSVGEMELAERLDLECDEGKRGLGDEVLVLVMNIWVAGSVSFAEAGTLKEKQEFSLVAEQEIRSSILDTITLRCPVDISVKM